MFSSRLHSFFTFPPVFVVNFATVRRARTFSGNASYSMSPTHRHTHAHRLSHTHRNTARSVARPSGHLTSLQNSAAGGVHSGVGAPTGEDEGRGCPCCRAAGTRPVCIEPAARSTIRGAGWDTPRLLCRVFILKRAVYALARVLEMF